MLTEISILLVEDVEEMMSLLVHVIQTIQGVRVSGQAKNTFEARLELSRRRPDLMFLDEVLPGDSSDDLLQEMRLEGIPVVLMTSMQEPNTHDLRGAVARVGKPGWKSIDTDRMKLEKVIFNGLKRSHA